MVIYKTVNQINTKWYIGKDAENRSYYLGSGKALINALKKYGKQNFIKIILEECSDLAHLSDREKHWIEITSATTDPMSYNIAPGGEGGNRHGFIDYTKIDYSNHKMTGTINWFNALTESERKDFHAEQALKRCKGWYISKVDDSTETYVLNISQWCKENSVGADRVSNLTNPNHALFQKQVKGWRFRKEGQDPLPIYVNKQKIGHPNPACKGKSWKMVNGIRVWFTKQGITK
jgi:hypothetical protein